MAGSRRQFEYTNDAGLAYEVQIDETVGEDAIFGFSAVQAATRTAGRYLSLSSTRPLEARYVLGTHVAANGDVFKVRRYVGSITADLWTGAASTFTDDAARVYSVTARIGEKRYDAPIFDTAIQDGDVDNNLTV